MLGKKKKQLSTQSFKPPPSPTPLKLLPFHSRWNLTLSPKLFLISLTQVTHPTLWIYNEHTEAGTVITVRWWWVQMTSICSVVEFIVLLLIGGIASDNTLWWVHM